MTNPHPIACSLSRQALTDRIAWIRALNRDFLRAYSLARTALRLVYDPAAARDIHTLVAREQECCGFLSFAIEESDATIELRIDAPDVGEMNAETLFAPFLSGAR